ncbi:MAG: MFS transporter [Deltaproteobacteria bacterium]|nr:MFS transporter [Deltaproteobacteria bacterium]MBW2052081.1 MFS transporter [Deltaproteobacteria bacterium]MBW2140702.1 MFS transporter [Deltaproteobacteria bacterium]MBW2322340.1 MFS transporter [Deltaproteobacteria bacterium]
MIFTGLVPLFVLAHFGHHLLTALPVPLLPMIRTDLGLDYTQSGLLISAFSLSYGIGQLPAGWLADRFGPRILITIGNCGVALAGFLVGLSPTYMMILICLMLMGIMGGGYHPAAPPLISASVSPQKQGSALGLHLVGGSASYFLAPLIGVAIAAAWGWRGSFLSLAVPAIIFGIIFYLLLGRLTPAKNIKEVKAASPAEAPSKPGRLRRLVVVMILSSCISAIFVSTIAFIPLFLVDHFGVGEKTAAAFLAIIFSGGLWAAPLGGYISDRLGKIPVLLTVCFITGPLIFLLNMIPYGVGIGILLLFLGICLSVRMPVTEAFIVSQTSEHNRSTIFGIYYFSAMESGGILTPIMGYSIDRLGFFYSYTIAGAALFVVTLICAPFLWSGREKALPEDNTAV